MINRSWRTYINISLTAAVLLITCVAAIRMNSTNAPSYRRASVDLAETVNRTRAITALSPTKVVTTDIRKIESLEDLLTLQPNQRAEVDIARANLLVATGVPNSGDLVIEEHLSTLDAWAAHVATETDRHMHRFQANAAEYRSSEAYFRILTMITVLQQDCGVRYNPDRINDPDFTKPEDLFIHGMTAGEGGTCVSMPVLYTAIAQRLGYPVRLVTTKAHVFARWEDESERMNIEATSQGLNVYDDAFYKTWPLPVTDEEIDANKWLLCLDESESIALFLAARGHVFEDTGGFDRAITAYHQAALLDPTRPIYAAYTRQAANRFIDQQLKFAERGNGTVGKRRGYNPLGEVARMNEVNRRRHDALRYRPGMLGGPSPDS